MRWRVHVRQARRSLGGALRSARLDPLPLRHQLRHYSGELFASDLRAGFNVALLAFPQGLAFAAIAGAPIVYGALGAAVAAILGGLFSSSRVTILGPSNATAFLLFSFFVGAPALAARQELLMPWLALLIGMILAVGAVLRLSDYTQYISRSVIVGYLTGAALLIIANQLRHVFGISLSVEGEPDPRTFFAVVGRLGLHLGKIQALPLTIGGVTVVCYLALQRRLAGWPNFALVLLLMTALAQGLVAIDPAWALDSFTAIDTSTLLPRLPRTDESLGELLQPLFGGAFALAFLSSLENSIMSRSLASRVGQEANGHQDTLSLGLANAGSALFGGMPASGSLTRSMLNFQSGARTGVAAIVSGVLCLLLTWLLSQAIGWVPKAVLAGLVIGVSVSLIQPRLLRICLRSTGSDALVLVVTFFATLLMPLHVAIFVGVGTAVMLYLRKAARPEMVEYDFADDGQLRALGEGEERSQPAVSIVHVEGDLFFGATDVFRSQVQEICRDPNLKVIVLRLRNARNMDATSILALGELVDFARSQERFLLMSGVRPKLYKVLSRSGMVDKIGREHFFINSPKNPNVATAKALRHASNLLGTDSAEVKIFVKKEGEKKGGEKEG